MPTSREFDCVRLESGWIPPSHSSSPIPINGVLCITRGGGHVLRRRGASPPPRTQPSRGQFQRVENREHVLAKRVTDSTQIPASAVETSPAIVCCISKGLTDPITLIGPNFRRSLIDGNRRTARTRIEKPRVFDRGEFMRTPAFRRSAAIRSCGPTFGLARVFSPDKFRYHDSLRLQTDLRLLADSPTRSSTGFYRASRLDV